MKTIERRVAALEEITMQPHGVLVVILQRPVTRFVSPATLGWGGEDATPLLHQPGEDEAAFIERGKTWAKALGLRGVIGEGDNDATA